MLPAHENRFRTVLNRIGYRVCRTFFIVSVTVMIHLQTQLLSQTLDRLVRANAFSVRLVVLRNDEAVVSSKTLRQRTYSTLFSPCENLLVTQLARCQPFSDKPVPPSLGFSP